MSEALTAAIDKAECAREPIHITGAIQPHGYLFILNAEDHTVISVSRNAADAFQLAPADIVGRAASDFLSSVTDEPLFSLISDNTRNLPLRVEVRLPVNPIELEGQLHRDGALLLLELELALPIEVASTLLAETRAGMEAIRRSPSAKGVCQALTAEIRRLTGFERVMVYSFDEDWNGQVIAESRLESVQSYLGHAFPASDIPEQARAMYLRNTYRRWAQLVTATR